MNLKPGQKGIASFASALDDALVPVQIVYGETELGRMARKLGGKWAADVKLWHIEYGKIKGTELEKHMILDVLVKKKAP